LTLPYRLQQTQLEVPAMHKEAKFRQRNLLDEDPAPMPKDIEAKVLELLIELLLGAVGPGVGDQADE
jgi:hypothetical protein